MGYESRVHIPAFSSNNADSVLRGIDGFSEFDQDLQLYSFRRQSTGEMPDAFAKLEDNAIYFCDNGPGGDIFSDLLRSVQEHFGDAVVEDL